MKKKNRKFSAITENQLETLESFLDFLRSLGVFRAYYLDSRRYMDTVTSHKLGITDSQWCDLYDVEEILIANADGDE